MSSKSQPPVANDKKATNGSWLRVHATLATIAVLKRFRPRYGCVLFLTPGICVKYGELKHLSEAESMQYIAANTNIPVPKVYCAFERKGMTYIVMSKIAGSPVGHGWVYRSEDSKARLLAQLKAYIQEMRTLKPPQEGVVQAVYGGKVFDSRVPRGVLGFGPFDTVRALHSFLREGVDSSSGPDTELTELKRMHNGTHPNVRFTHGDLSSMNILCKGDEIVGIVDWDTAGWWPEYWEYTTAMNVNAFNVFWKPEVPNFLDAYPDALEMETLREKYFGDF